MIIRCALSGVKKKIRPRRRAVLVLVLGRGRAAGLGAKTFYRVTSVAQLAAAISSAVSSCLPGSRRILAFSSAGAVCSARLPSSPMTYHTAIQMRQRMRVSSSFFERKKSGECSVHSQFSSAFRDCGASRRGRTPQLNCIKPSQEYSKKRDGRMCFLLTQDALCDSRRTHSADFFLS